MKIIIKILTFVMVLSVFSSFVVAQTLAGYPDFYVDDDELDVIIVVGDKASSSHALAQAQIALSLTNFVGKRVFGLAKLASEVDDIDNLNIISIGNACDNEVSSVILGVPESCGQGLESGKATIELYRSGDNVHIVLNAFSDKGIDKASDVLSNYEFYNFKGTVFETIVFEDPVEEVEEEQIKEENVAEVEVEDIGVVIEEPEIVEEEEEPVVEKVNIIKRIINWFASLFG